MDKPATQVLCGTWGRVWFDGTEVGNVTNITASITNNYEDVPVGSDVDRKLVSQTGEGTLTFNQTDNLTSKLAKAYQGGKDPRFVIETNLKDPSALNAQQEGYTINNISLDSVPFLGMEKGALISKEISFRFTPSDLVVNDEIFPEE